jgi:hypothetical protein
VKPPIQALRQHLLESSPKLLGDKVVTSQDKEYVIIHQYDRIPEWKKIIEEKYND